MPALNAGYSEDLGVRNDQLTPQVVGSKRFVFIVGPARSGTTWLQLLLSASPYIATVNETHLFSYLEPAFRRWDSLHGQKVRAVGVHQFMTRDEFYALMRNVADDVLRRIAATKPNASIVLEKTPHHVRHWRRILDLYPGAMFIHVVRDPRAVVASMLDARKDWGSTDWVSPTAAGNSRRWLSDFRAGREIRDATPNYLEVRYEDLKINGPATLLGVLAWLGISATEIECAEVMSQYSVSALSNKLCSAPWDLQSEPARFYRKGEADGWREDLNLSQVSLIEALTAKEMSELGYSPSAPWWVALPGLFADKLRQALKWRLAAVEERL